MPDPTNPAPKTAPKGSPRAADRAARPGMPTGVRVSGQRPKRKRTANRAQLTFAILGLVVIVSMIFGLIAVGFDFRLGGNPTPADQAPLGSNSVPTYEARLRDNPNDVNTMVILANTLQVQGDFPSAINWYERATVLKPDDVDIRLAFGQALASYGQRFDAEAQYKRVLELDSQNAQAEFYLGDLYRTWLPPRPEDALAHYQRASDLQPEGNWGRAARSAIGRLPGTPVPPTATP